MHIFCAIWLNYFPINFKKKIQIVEVLNLIFFYEIADGHGPVEAFWKLPWEPSFFKLRLEFSVGQVEGQEVSTHVV